MMTRVTLHLTSPQGEVGGGEVSINEAICYGAGDVRVQTVHTGPQTVPHSGAQIPAHCLKCKLSRIENGFSRKYMS